VEILTFFKEMNEMKIKKGYIVVGLIVAFALFFELAAHADESDQLTTFTFSAPVQIPGHVLPAGTYVFQLATADSDRNVVQIFNADRTHLYAIVETIAAERLTPTEDTAVTFAEPGSGEPDVLLKWFYPGNMTGNEFLYSPREEKQLAQDKQQIVVANQQKSSRSEAVGAGN
jgi:hypothetical protein